MANVAASAERSRLAGLAWPVALLLAAMVSMQVGAAFAKGIFPAVGPQGATALRLAFSALILATIQRPWRGRRLGGHIAPLIAYGLALGAMNTLFYTALRTVPLGVAIALEFIGPLCVAMMSTRRWLDGLWILLAATGLALLLPLTHETRAMDPVGAALALASGGFWALYILFGRRVGQAFGTRGAALGVVIAAAVFAPLDAIAAGPQVFTLAVLPAGFVLALLSSALPYSLEMIALARVPPRVFGTLMSLEPAVGALAGLAVLREAPSLPQWLGILAVVLASAGATLTVEPRKAQVVA